MARTGESEAPGPPGRPGADLETSGSGRRDVGEDPEIELLGDGEPDDEVDPREETWSPGEPAPGVPADEVLYVHPLTDVAPSAELLDVSEDDLELPVPEDEPSAKTPGVTADELRERTFLRGHDLETRYEELDSEDTALNALEGTAAVPAETEFVCTSCFLRRHAAQLADPQRRICQDCAASGVA